MTAIAGCISLTGDPVDRGTIERMKNVLGIYGQDDGHSLIVLGAGFVRTLLRVTPEDRFDSQPLRHQATGTVIVFDGRLDNRLELARSLKIDSSELAFMADSELALRIFLRFGADCFGRFLGDFCIAVWQQRDRRLILARSPSGLRPLFWACRNGLFAFGTMPKALFAVPGVSRELSDEGLHDYMCMIPVQGEKYLFKDILRLEPGCLVVVNGSQVTRRRYHSFEGIAETNLSSDDEYVEAFAEVFEAALDCRLRSSGTISSHLSGGFDSGVVTGVAALQLSGKGLGLTSYTAVPRSDVRERLHPASRFDEASSAAALAVQFPNVEHELVEPLDESLAWVVREEVELLDCPPLNVYNSSWVRAINTRAAARGSKALLTGMLGNATISYSGEGIFAHLLRSGRFREWWTESAASVAARSDWGVRSVLKRSLFPFLPIWAWVLHERARGRDPRVQTYSPASPAVMKQLRSADRARRLGWDLTYKPVSDSRKLRQQMLAFQEIGIYFAAANAAGLEWRDPTADQRVVEFCLSVPETQYWHRGADRWLLRRYMRRILPEETVQSRLQGVQGADWAIRFREQASDIASNLSGLSALSKAGDLVDLPNLQQSLHRLQTAKLASWSADREYKTKLLRGLTAAEFVRYTTGENE